jgi:hypothetical protein
MLNDPHQLVSRGDGEADARDFPPVEMEVGGTNPGELGTYEQTVLRRLG